MDESLLEVVLGGGVRHSCKSDQTVLEDVDLQGLEACHEHVEPHVILVTTQEVRLR